MTKPQLHCISCTNTYPLHELRYHCDCGDLLKVEHGQIPGVESLKDSFDRRLTSRRDVDRSGVWRFREAVLRIRDQDVVTHPEGGTNLYRRQDFTDFAQLANIALKHEGENPTGSFKDRGMTVAISQAKSLGMKKVACASTGNTSAALAAYAAQAGMEAFVFLPAGKVATGKLAQAIGYGAKCLAIRGDFDDAMGLVQRAAKDLGLYLVNSVNPFRLEGQKTIIWEIFQDMGWQAPDWIVVPGGNLGNTSAFGKAIEEAFQWGWIDKKPRIATVQAAGANPFYESFIRKFDVLKPKQAETIATAIRIGNPVNFNKAKRVIDDLKGVVTQVTDAEIMAAKRVIDETGVGCEPASAASLAGTRKLVSEGVISRTANTVCIVTGHILKDTDAIMKRDHLDRQMVETDSTLEAVAKHIT